jgi:hypothetical protein
MCTNLGLRKGLKQSPKLKSREGLPVSLVGVKLESLGGDKKDPEEVGDKRLL